jgi:hypothetical protein
MKGNRFIFEVGSIGIAILVMGVSVGIGWLMRKDPLAWLDIPLVLGMYWLWFGAPASKWISEKRDKIKEVSNAE